GAGHGGRQVPPPARLAADRLQLDADCHRPTASTTGAVLSSASPLSSAPRSRLSATGRPLVRRGNDGCARGTPVTDARLVRPAARPPAPRPPAPPGPSRPPRRRARHLGP